MHEKQVIYSRAGVSGKSEVKSDYNLCEKHATLTSSTKMRI